MREVLCILKQAKKGTSQTTYIKAPAANLPQLNLEMTPYNSESSELIWKFLPQ